MNYIKKFKTLLDKKTTLNLLWLVLFSVFVSVVETVGISAIMPFIDVVTNFDVIHNNEYYKQAFDFFGFDKTLSGNVQFSIVFGLLLLAFYVFRGVVNLLYSYVMARFTQGLYEQITRQLFNTYLTMPYQLFTYKNSSYLTKAIITEASLMSGVISSVLLIISEVLIVVFLYTLMLFASWKITIIFTAILSIKIFLLTKTVSREIKKVGKIRSKSQQQFYEVINRLFGDFKQVKLLDKKRVQAIQENFGATVNEYTRSNITHSFLNNVPRVFLETTGFSLVIALLVALLYLNQSNVAYILPTLSLFVLALYRILPSANRIMVGYNTIMFNHKSIVIINNELQTPQEHLGSNVLEFGHTIELEHVCFSYQTNLVLDDINLTINRGSKIAFVGKSGSGKSTLVDLIIGLYYPSQGEVRVDGVSISKANVQSWRSQIGYIPQQVYLFDGTIKENVCFGRKVDEDLLQKVLKQANIFNFLQEKQGVDTVVGEGGVQLSGGQRQRIAIARALYGEPGVLVLDEATSALDESTERKIMDEIYQISENKTLIIIAHRTSTIKQCDMVYEIKNKTIDN